jgi:hypothetical protein
MNRRQKPAWKAVLLFATKAQRREVGFSLSAGADIICVLIEET